MRDLALGCHALIAKAWGAPPLVAARTEEIADEVRFAMATLYGGGDVRFTHECDVARKEGNDALDELLAIALATKTSGR